MTQIGFRWRVTHGCNEAVAGVGAPDWSNLAGDARAILLKRNPRREVWKVNTGDGAVIAKVYRESGSSGWLRRYFRGSDARREWEIASRAAATGLTPTPIGFGEGQRGRDDDAGHHRRISVFLSEYQAGGKSLADAWKVLGAFSVDSIRRADLLIRGLAGFVARAHRAGFIHADSHPKNILITERDGHALELTYIDVAGSIMGRWISEARVTANLAELAQWFIRHGTRTQRMRFLGHYLAERGIEATQRRPWFRRIARASEKHRRRLIAKRDRRILRGGNPYFDGLSLPDGWNARVLLQLHHGDELPGDAVGPMSLDEWRACLAKMLTAVSETKESLRLQESETAASLRFNDFRIDLHTLWAWDRYGWWWGRMSGPRRAFAAAHRRRHREQPGLCPVALLERRAWGRLTHVAIVWRNGE